MTTRPKGWIGNVLIENDTLNAIGNYEPLAVMLNEFVANYKGSGSPIRIGNPARYDLESKAIFIEESFFDSLQQYRVATALAHEVAHALSKYNLDDQSSLDTYIYERRMSEGEALYYEFLAFKNMYPGITEYYPLIWEDNQDVIINNPHDPAAPRINYYDAVINIINSADTYYEKITALGKLKAVQVSANPGGLAFTYDEADKWYWLKHNTDIAIDYLEAMRGSFCLGDYSRDAAGRERAHEAIQRWFSEMFDIKVLVNKAHQYFGTDGADILWAEENGSTLGLESGNEVLWGGKGDDVLHGSTTEDILLGGDGNDVLWGYAGDDILAGNQGHDRLYGGGGNDTYVINATNLAELRPDLIGDTSAGEGSVQFYTISSVDGSKILTTLTGGTKLTGTTKEFTTYANASEPGIEYRFQPADEGASLGALYIYYQNKLVTVIKDFDKSGTYLGIRLDDNAAAPEPQVTIPGLDLTKANNITINKQTDGRMVVADLSGGTLADYVTGSDGRETVYCGEAFGLRSILSFPLAEFRYGLITVRNI